jgi:hypothetical protein
LHAFLHSHPRIALMYEAEPFGLYAPDPDYIFPEDWTARLEFFNQAFSRHRLDAMALPRKQPARECALGLFRTWAARKQATVMGGKSPIYHRYLPDIARIFPEANFIIIWRDPLDTCRSAVNAGKRNRFFSQKGILPQVFFGSQQLAKGVLQLRAAGRRVHEMVYPELVHDPESELRKICGFLGLEFDARMLDLAAADYSMLPPGEHHALARSGAVKKKGERAEVLPAKFIAKGRRYAVLWRQQYADLALVRALSQPAAAHPPGQWERWLDLVIYRSWWGLMNLRHLAARRLPVSIWQRLRGK